MIFFISLTDNPVLNETLYIASFNGEFFVNLTGLSLLFPWLQYGNVLHFGLILTKDPPGICDFFQDLPLPFKVFPLILTS